jgi:hypothetical protein
MDRPNYTIVTGEWEIGRIYETRGGPDSLRWFWSKTSTARRRGRIAWRPWKTKGQFQKGWDAWKAWGKLEEMSEDGLDAVMEPSGGLILQARFYFSVVVSRVARPTSSTSSRSIIGQHQRVLPLFARARLLLNQD